MEDAIIRQGIPLAALLVYVSSLGIPTGIPIKVVLLAVGSAVVKSPEQLAAAFAVLVLAEMAGTMSLLYVSRFAGTRLPARLQATQDKPQIAFDNWRVRLHGKDPLAIFVLRLVPLVRIGLTIGAGAFGIRVRDFVVGAFPAACSWMGLPLGLGWVFREDVARAEEWLAERLGGPLAVVVIVVVVALVLALPKIIKTIRHRGDQAPIPLSNEKGIPE
ncbi:MAG: DedA family protein [Chloroflexota bacterium]